MGSKRLWLTTIVTVLALYAVGPRSPGVWAQSMASCRSGWDWNKNSLGQDPCLTGSFLERACRGKASYTIPPLTGTEYYAPPQALTTGDLKCECDTIMYSLYEACSTCQGGRILSWKNWTSQCDVVYVTQYPHDVPSGTAIPRWAFYDVTTLPNQTYDDAVAISVGRNPEVTSNTLTTSSKRSSTKPSTLGTSTSRPSSTSTVGGFLSNSVIRIIIGSVVGIVVPLLILAFVVAFILRRRRRVRPCSQQTPVYYGEQPTPPTPSTGYYQGQPTPPTPIAEYYQGQPMRPAPTAEHYRGQPTWPSPTKEYYQGQPTQPTPTAEYYQGQPTSPTLTTVPGRVLTPEYYQGQPTSPTLTTEYYQGQPASPTLTTVPGRVLTPEYYQGQPTSPTLTTASSNLPLYSPYHNNYGPQGQGQGRFNGMPEI